MLGTVALAAGDVLLLLRGRIPDFLSVVAANPLLVLAMALIHHGLRRYFRAPARGLVIFGYILAAAMAPAFVVFLYFAPNVPVRIVLVATGFLVELALVYSTFPAQYRGTIPVHLMRGGAVLVAVISLVRIVLVVTRPGLQNPFESGVGFTGTVLVGNLAAVGFAVALILLVSERLQGLERSVSQKYQVLLKEVHHRVKNSIATAQSVLRITEGSGPGVDAEEILKQADLRLSTFGTAHELLYRLDGGASSRLDQYLDEIAKNALTACTDSPVDLDLKLEPVVVHLSRMIPCGLIVNELVTNACKYAFPAGSRGTIALHLCVAGDGRQRTLRLMVSDDGVGLPTDHEGHGGLGLSLVRSLCKQIHGTLTVDGAGGTTVYLEFPISDSD